MNRSPLQIIAGTRVTDAMLVGTNLAETEHAAYSGSATYNKGSRVIHQHVIYESVQDGNTGNTPGALDSGQWWGKVGPTNKWAAFDLSSSTKALMTGDSYFELRSGQSISSVMLINCAGIQSVRLRLIEGGTTHFDQLHSMAAVMSEPTWYSWFFDSRVNKTRLIVSDLPARPLATLRIDIYPIGSETASVGTVQFGRSYKVGIGVKTGVTLERLDFSSAEENKYTGEIDYLMPRPPGKRQQLTVVLDPSEFDATDALLDRLVGVPCMFIVPGPFKALSLWGYLPGSSQSVPYVNAPELNITIRGFPQ